MKKNICIFVPDGVGIRNYLYSKVLTYLMEKDVNILVFHSISDKALEEVGKLHPKMDIKYYKIPEYKESLAEKFYMELENLCRLRYFSRKLNNPTLLTNRRKKRKGIKQKLFYSVIEFLAFFIYSYNIIIKINRRYLNAVAKSKYIKKYSQLLKENNIDTILCTHQRALTASPMFAAADMLNINSVVAIYSWDNLPKARMAFRADKYLVWSDYMKDEMRLYYPEIDEKKIVVTGTPQFEFYKEIELIESREAFCLKYGLDPLKRIVCYSGGDTRTSPYDQNYLKDMAEEILTLPDNERPQILFRRCPVDWSDRFDDVLREYENVIVSVDPLWNYDKDNKRDWSITYPAYNDVKLLVNVAYHSDVVYNVGSTMAHDYSMFDKPACYINYDPPEVKGWSVKKIYKLQHFRSMPETDPVIWINSKDEISEKVINGIKNPDKVAKGRIEWLTKIVRHPVEDASGNVINQLIN